MWYNFFVFGGIWFWGLTALEFILLFYYAYNENATASFVSLIFFIALIHLFGNADWFSYIKNNSLNMIRYIVIYLCMGVCFYMIFSAYNMLTFKMYVKELKEKWSKENTTETWDNYFSAAAPRKEKRKAELQYYKDKAPLWIIWWPIVFITALLGDLLVNCIKYLYILFFERLIKKMHSTILGDFYINR